MRICPRLKKTTKLNTCDSELGLEHKGIFGKTGLSQIMGITHCAFLMFDGCSVVMQNSVFELRKNTGEYGEWPRMSPTSRVITVIIGDSTQGTK